MATDIATRGFSRKQFVSHCIVCTTQTLYFFVCLNCVLSVWFYMTYLIYARKKDVSLIHSRQVSSNLDGHQHALNKYMGRKLFMFCLVAQALSQISFSI